VLDAGRVGGDTGSSAAWYCAVSAHQSGQVMVIGTVVVVTAVPLDGGSVHRLRIWHIDGTRPVS
jgi:hypothetical protein